MGAQLGIRYIDNEEGIYSRSTMITIGHYTADASVLCIPFNQAEQVLCYVYMLRDSDNPSL